MMLNGEQELSHQLALVEATNPYFRDPSYILAVPSTLPVSPSVKDEVRATESLLHLRVWIFFGPVTVKCRRNRPDIITGPGGVNSSLKSQKKSWSKKRPPC